jgi:hypothetical protein
LRAGETSVIIKSSTTGGLAVCHEWWLQRRKIEEAEASRRMWDEFERTRPLTDVEVPEEEPEVTLEEPRTPRFAAQDPS